MADAKLDGVIRFLVAALVTVLVFGCSSDEADEPLPSPGATSFPTPAPGATFPPGQTPEPISIEEFEPMLDIQGVFTSPQETQVAANVELPPRPEPQFEAWDGASVVIYDIHSGQQHDFGPGKIWTPAFGSGHFVYTNDNEVWLVNLQSMESESLGGGIVAYFLGNQYVVINPGDNQFEAVRVETGARAPLRELTSPLFGSMVQQRWGGQFLGEWISDRYVVRLAENPATVCEDSGTAQRQCVAHVSNQWVVEDLRSQEVLLAFEASAVEPAGSLEVVIATTPRCEEDRVTSCYNRLAQLEAQNPNAPGPLFVEGTTNIFLVDLETGEAEFIATATYHAATGSWPMNWPLAANEDYVVWTESYCGEPRGNTRVYDRASGEITELNQSHWVSLADGLLGLGEFGAKALMDLESFEYASVLPDLADVTWSRDFRYAAVGPSFGHEGICESPR